ncbi:hypothetical protein D3C73_1412040 [compost metagenome]
MAHSPGSGPLQIRTRHVSEILLGLQDGHVGVVEVQERLQVSELVLFPEFLNVFVRQFDAVSFGQGKDQLWLESPFDVQVQFGNRRRR